MAACKDGHTRRREISARRGSDYACDSLAKRCRRAIPGTRLRVHNLHEKARPQTLSDPTVLPKDTKGLTTDSYASSERSETQYRYACYVYTRSDLRVARTVLPSSMRRVSTLRIVIRTAPYGRRTSRKQHLSDRIAEEVGKRDYRFIYLLLTSYETDKTNHT